MTVPKPIIVSSGIGNITHGDIKIAENTGSIIVAFNVRVDKSVESSLETLNIKVSSQRIFLSGLKPKLIYAFFSGGAIQMFFKRNHMRFLIPFAGNSSNFFKA